LLKLSEILKTKETTIVLNKIKTGNGLGKGFGRFSGCVNNTL
jgi:hypothetical protein